MTVTEQQKFLEQLKHRFCPHTVPTADDDSDDGNKAMRDVSVKIQALALQIAKDVPSGREQSQALSALEQVMFYSNAGIARRGTINPEYARRWNDIEKGLF